MVLHDCRQAGQPAIWLTVAMTVDFSAPADSSSGMQMAVPVMMVPSAACVVPRSAANAAA